MDSDNHPYSILSPYSPHPTNQYRMNTIHQQPLRDHILHPVPRQYTSALEFQDNYGIEPQPSMLHNTSRYRDSSRPVKQEHDLNTYVYSTPIDFRGDMGYHHPTHRPDHSSIRYPASHNHYSSAVNSSNTIRIASSPLESPESRLPSGPAESGSADFRYQIRAALHPQQPHLLHPQPHQHSSVPHHHQHQNHSLNHLQGGSAFYSNYSSHDQEHGSPNSMDLPQSQLSSSLDYDSRESHAQHVPVPGMVYDPLAVSSHSQQGVGRRDSTMNSHHGSLASINGSNSGSGGGSYHTPNSPVSSIPMSNNNHSTSSSMNTSVLGAHISSPFSIGTSSNLRWAGHHPSGFDMPGSTAAQGQIPTPSSTSTSSSSLRSSLRHADSDSRLTPPENSFTQDNFHLRTSTSAQTLSSSYSHTNSSSPLSGNESTSPGAGGSSEMYNNNPDDRDWSDQDVDSAIRMSENSSAAGRKGVVVIRAGEEVKKEALTTPPVKKKKKSKMHCCEVCMKKFPRPSGLRTHMNTHSNEKPYPCGFPGCNRSFGVRSNAKRHLRTHGVIPAPAVSPNSTDPPYVVGFCTPMIGGAPQPSSSSHHQLHSIEGGGEEDFPLPGGSRLPGDHNGANIHHHHTQDHQGQSDVQQQQQHEIMGSAAPALKLRWMPPSLTTRTNASSLREVVDEQQQQHHVQRWMGDVVEEEEDGADDDDFAAGRNGTIIISHARRGSGGGYDTMDVDQRLTMSHPAECTTVYSPPSSKSPSTQGTCRPPSSSSRIIAPSISPSSTSSSFARSNSSLSPPSTMSSGYGQQQHDIDHITNVGGGPGGDVLYTTRSENISREYGGV